MKKENGIPNFVKMEQDMLRFWEAEQCFEKLKQKNSGGLNFRFLDGPITANNRMGVHHFWGRALKDITIRYNALKGRDCMYQNGFDSQGMWVEVNIEKELGLNGKPEIVKYGIDKFTDKCMERVNYFAGEITRQSKRMGQMMDWKNSYFTNTDGNILSIWNFLKKCDENGWIIRKNRPMVWCPRCGTSLSEHEMTGSYKEVVHTALFVKFPVKNHDFKMLAWTTTPWTLSANVALAVNPNNEYVKIETSPDGEKLVLGAEAQRAIKTPYKILETFKGEKLLGLVYETCFPTLESQQFDHKIIAWKDVDSLEGCGVVHIAPGCGEEDFELGKLYNLPEICPIDEQGVMLRDTGFMAGHKTTEVTQLIVDDLKRHNKLLYSHPYKHSYPFCWRCKTDLVYKLVNTWYIKMDDLRPRLLKALDEVEFTPDFAKKRMIDWLNNMGDWNISRARFYGLPLPIYICEKCGKIHVIGSLDELRQKAVNPEGLKSIPHLHRPWIDDIMIKCGCGEIAKRIPEVGDCWLDAGITPFSTKKYFEDKKFFKNNFPSEYVCEMIEQIKLWFYSMLVMSVVLENKAPYQKVVTYQYVKDENGNEFHKSGGNNLECDIVADKVGADAIRYLYASANPNNEMRFGFNLTDEARRKMMGLFNAYAFFNTYACIDNPDIASFKPDKNKFNITDKWLIERINQFVKDSDTNYQNYKSFLVVKDFEVLMDDISNFYIRLNRKRFWKTDDEGDQMTAYWCLYYALKKVCIIMNPIIPFITEYIWQNMIREVEKEEAVSVVLSDYPAVFSYGFGDVVEKSMAVREIITAALALRGENQIKVKQPLKTMYLIGASAGAVKDFEQIIKDELNIKDIVTEKDNSKFNEPYLSVNFKTAGAVLKGEVQKLKEILTQASSKDMAKWVGEYHKGSVNTGGFAGLGNDIFILNFKPKPDFVIAVLGGITIVLDITIDENLMLEGLFRELVRHAQVLRKEADFKIEERINADIKTNGKTMTQVIKKFEEALKQDVLIKTLNGGIKKPEISKTFDIGEEEVTISMSSGGVPAGCC
ncbi:MAG: isoleucine--tRNA ligase [Christensenellaceae bacterium]|nr:isoleucine--tRNA ligase [Christensenellaceae bacterium]